MYPIKTIDFEEALIDVIKKEFCCTEHRAKFIIELAVNKQRNFLLMENQFKIIVNEILNDGFVFNKMGGFGPLESDKYYYSIYFRDKTHSRGIVPKRFFKKSVDGVEPNLKNWDDVDKVLCQKCKKETPIIEIEEKRPERVVYEISYCKVCDRLFLNNKRSIGAKK